MGRVSHKTELSMRVVLQIKRKRLVDWTGEPPPERLNFVLGSKWLLFLMLLQNVWRPVRL